MTKGIIFKHKIYIISNGDFILDLLNLVLKNSLMQFQEDIFQQIFGVIMGTNVAPIFGESIHGKTGKNPQRKMFGKPKTNMAIILCQLY